MRTILSIAALLAVASLSAATDCGEIVVRNPPTGFVAATNVVRRAQNGAASYVRIEDAAALGVDSATWPDGASALLVADVAGTTYSPTNALQLVGYGAWPTNSFQAVVWRVGGSFKVNVLSEFAAAPAVAFGADGYDSATFAPVGWTMLDNTVVWQKNGNAVDVVLAAGEELAASAAGWTDGQSVLVAVHPAGAYTVAADITLLGYGAWPTEDFYCVVWRVGANFYANIVQ